MKMRSKMKKGLAVLLSGGVAFGMAAGIVPGIPENTLYVKAADTEHKHCVCGTNDVVAGGHVCDKEQVWTGVSDLSEITGSGYYYLTDNITLDKYVSSDSSYTCYGWVAPDGVVLCLNGHSIIMNNPDENDVDKSLEENKYYDGYVDVIGVENHFTLTDCKTGDQQGKITHAENKKGRGIDIPGTEFNMYGGKISGNTTAYDRGGSGVIVRKNYNYTKAGTFNLYDGEISGNVCKFGAGVSVFGGIFNVYGGRITNNVADSNVGKGSDLGHGGGVYVGWTSKFYMAGGSITGNTSNNTGAGVYACSFAEGPGVANLEVTDAATITGNKNNGKDDNLCLTSSTYGDCTLNTTLNIKGTLTGKIGVNSGDISEENNSIIIATGASADTDYSGIIVSDDDKYKVIHGSSDRTTLLLMDKNAVPPVEKPAITGQPQNASVKAGEKATYTVTATGTDITYQWKIDRNDGKGFVDISGANSASYTTGVTDKDCNEFKYQCIISNSAGSVTTDTVTLTVIDNTTPEPDSTPAQYKIIEGANSSWTQNTDGSLVIKGDGDISKFQNVKVDGVVVDAKNYTVSEGSTIITIKADYLNTLSADSHTFEIVWTDGSARTSFTVVANTSDDSNTGNDDVDDDADDDTTDDSDVDNDDTDDDTTDDSDVDNDDTDDDTTDDSDVDDDTTDKNTTDNGNSKDNTKGNTDNKLTQTGDTFNLTLCATLLMVSLAGCAAILVGRKKNNK